MPRDIDFKLIGLGVLILVMVIIVASMFSPLEGISDPQKMASFIEEIIDKAMIQCYALEGSYPSSLEYLVNYGIVLDNSAYFYYFEPIGSNVKPIVIVFPK
jgi:hypothetical protein